MYEEAAVGGIALLERAVNYLLGNLLLVTPDALARPTPCMGWDLRALLTHLDDSLGALTEAVEAGAVGLDTAGPPATGEPSTVRAAATHLLGALAGARHRVEVSVGGRPLTTAIVTSTGAVEVAVHGWDVAQACGADRPIPRALADELLDLCTLLVTDLDRPARFAAAVAVSPHADSGDRLLAFLGRKPYPLISRAA
jgi:uncharacterized protein (TIGR03086 family)